MNKQILTSDPLETLKIREAAALLHVSHPTVTKYIKNGELPSMLIGRCRRIRRTDLEAFIERRTAYGWREYVPEAPTTDQPTAWADEGDDIPF